MDCEAEYQRVYVSKNIEKVGLSNKERARRNPKRYEINKKRWEDRKVSKEWAEYRKTYFANNQTQREKHSVIAQKEHEFHRDKLTDRYCIDKIRGKDFAIISKESILQYPELIETYRQNIKLLRLLNQKQTK